MLWYISTNLTLLNAIDLLNTEPLLDIINGDYDANGMYRLVNVNQYKVYRRREIFIT